MNFDYSQFVHNNLDRLTYLQLKGACENNFSFQQFCQSDIGQNYLSYRKANYEKILARQPIYHANSYIEPVVGTALKIRSTGELYVVTHVYLPEEDGIIRSAIVKKVKSLSDPYVYFDADIPPKQLKLKNGQWVLMSMGQVVDKVIFFY